MKPGVLERTLWKKDYVGSSGEGRRETVKLFNSREFGTPKPERLLDRILYLATDPGDLVLDCFLGSGTTAAVAQKTGRRYIGIEREDSIEKFAKSRLDQTIAGVEYSKIDKKHNWKGGGGYRFYEARPVEKTEESTAPENNT